jgi:hypothetical protein
VSCSFYSFKVTVKFEFITCWNAAFMHTMLEYLDEQILPDQRGEFAQCSSEKSIHINTLQPQYWFLYLFRDQYKWIARILKGVASLTSRKERKSIKLRRLKALSKVRQIMLLKYVWDMQNNSLTQRKIRMLSAVQKGSNIITTYRKYKHRLSYLSMIKKNCCNY